MPWLWFLHTAGLGQATCLSLLANPFCFRGCGLLLLLPGYHLVLPSICHFFQESSTSLETEIPPPGVNHPEDYSCNI